MVEKGVDIDAVSVNTAIAAAEAVGDDARAAELREGAPFKGEDENASSESDESEDGSEVGSEDDAEPDIVREPLRVAKTSSSRKKTRRNVSPRGNENAKRRRNF